MNQGFAFLFYCHARKREGKSALASSNDNKNALFHPDYHRRCLNFTGSA
jgi:hypothetical protein